MQLSPTQPGAEILTLQHLDAPVALCSTDGVIQAGTTQAFALLRRTRALQGPTTALPQELWTILEGAPAGEAVEWRPPRDGQCVLGFTRYHYGTRYLVLMKEVSEKHAALSLRLHRQRLEAIGGLVASVAHELRNAVANIAYSAELLEIAGTALSPDALGETLQEIGLGTRRLRDTVDSLLGYARVGPSEFVPVSVRDVLTRSQGFLRSVYRPGGHRLSVEIDAHLPAVRGNSLTVEQIFVNLLLNAAQASEAPLDVRVVADLAVPPGAPADAPRQVRVRVSDNGPGIAPHRRELVFQPFFTSREEGSGLGLTIAKEAVERLGGALVLEDPMHEDPMHEGQVHEDPMHEDLRQQGPTREGGLTGACFAVYLPQHPRTDEPDPSTASQATR